MKLASNVWYTLIAPWRVGAPASPPARRRRRRQAELSWDCFEDRVVLSRLGGLRHSDALTSSLVAQAGTSTLTSARGSTNSAANSAVSTAVQTLRSEIQAIQAKSSTTVGQLTAIRTAFQTLRDDGLTPTSRSALASFQNNLVKAFASGTTLSGNATLLSEFIALYTSSPTAQQTTDLTAAYEAMAAAVTSSNITSNDLAQIDSDYTAVLAAKGSTSTATFPYFSLVTGGRGGRFGGGGLGGGCR